ncbi:hypothetical protein Taro_004623, partial [Colocasia esculenta]|nr:hypothetical protein [Colocasia esculenta]
VIGVRSESLHETCFLVTSDHVFCSGRATSVDTACASVDLLSQNSPDGVLGRPLVSTLHGLVSTHCPSLARRATSVDTACASVDLLSQNSPDGVLGRPLVSTLHGLVSTHCPSLARRCSGSCLYTVSTLPGLVSTQLDLFALYLRHCVDTTWTSVDTTWTSVDTT